MATTRGEMEFVEVRHDDGVAIVTMNRPNVRNAINDAMRAEMIETFDRLGSDKAVKAIVLTGAGKGFCSGGDVSGMRQRLEAPAGEVAFNGWKRQLSTHKGVAAIHNVMKPVIAAVNGPAMGLGFDMALACDFIMAADTATMAVNFIKRGLVSDGGGMYFLPRRVGLSKAKELLFTGRTLDAAEALDLGMIDRIAPAADLVPSAIAWAKELSQGSSAALALTKSIIDRSFETTDDQVFALGRQAQATCYTTAEHRASVEAFLAKIGK
jgi:enoyl-CoA hydratase/carnithine racemase